MATATAIPKHSVTLIPLDGPAATRRAELSGLAWYADYLFLLPQYPSRFDDQLFALPKEALESFLNGEREGPLTPRPVPLEDGGLSEEVAGFEGFEALGFAGEQVFVTVEAREREGMMGYLVSGRVEPGPAIILDADSRVPIPPQAALSNYSDEALTVLEDPNLVLTLYEANGVHVNPVPVGHLFGPDSTPLGTVPFTNLEYRISDCTAPDTEGRFWVVNYFYPGDRDKLDPVEPEPLARQYGVEHPAEEPVERLVELQFIGKGITLTTTPPLWLTLAEDGKARNWEGIARLDDGGLRGFLLVSDKHPETLLAFVPAP